MENFEISDDLIQRLTTIRRDIHKNPETAFEESETAGLIASFLDDLDLDVRRGVGGTGVTAVIPGTREKPVVALRADMDALPMKEETGLPYASTFGAMHACGHDGHVAVLLGAAAVLAGAREDLPGVVKVIFQPAEEKGLGAAAIIEDGVLEDPKVNAIFSLHSWPDLEVGRIGIRSGPMCASAEAFKITVEGKGCHGGYPHRGIDPIVAAAKIIDNLQVLVSRERDPLDPAVISIGMIEGGTAPNRIPDEVILQGTVRALHEETRIEMHEKMKRVIEGTAKALGAEGYLAMLPGGTKVVLNDPAMTRLVREAAEESLGAGSVSELDNPTMGGEDFSEYLQQVPGCFFRLGIRGKDQSDHPSLHQSDFNFNDDAIEPGVRILAATARRYLASRT
jgi:amidohydrolase